MSESLRRIRSIAWADFLIRFRRPSTLIVFLLLSGFAYVWVPDPATGRTLLEIDGKRALYNSAAIGMATASLATILIGLAGFYVMSNAVRRDVQSRCGFVIASTTMRAGEYLIAKFFGNVVFLTVFICGFMTTSMVMLVLRAEAPLQPLVFLMQYLLLAPPVIVFVSAVAITFESIPWLSGKFGDVLYFFLWIGSLGIVASNIKGDDPGILGYFDFAGFGFLRVGVGTEHMSIGATSFDAAKGLYVFNGLMLHPEWVMPRIVSTLLPVSLLLVALLFFHRFDPARLKQSAQKGNRNWIARLSNLAKPLVRPIHALASRGAGQSIASLARHDALLAIAAFPLALLMAVGFAIAGLAAQPSELLPTAFAAAALLIADVAAREARAGTLPLIYSSPQLKRSFVFWKFTAALMLMAPILFIPGLRLVLRSVSALTPLLVGIGCVAAVATALGVISSNPKTFIVVFLTFWYAVMSDHGQTAALDFAGFYGKASIGVTAAYAALAMAALAAAQIFHTARLRRAW
jgi:hypothetical protein